MIKELDKVNNDSILLPSAARAIHKSSEQQSWP